MKKIKFNGVERLCPTSWDDVTIGMQQQVSKVAALQSHVKMLGIISAYCGIPVEELKVVKLSKVYDLMESLTFMGTEIPTNKALEWEFEGHTYKVDKELGEMQFQDFISIQTILAENKETYYDALPIVIAILCKRDGETLDDFDPMERQHIIKKMPISVGSSIAAFFLLNENYSKLLTHLSSPQVQETILLGKISELKYIQSRLGVQRGGKLRIRFLGGILKRYTTHLERQLKKHFNFIQSESLTTNSKQTCKKLRMKKRNQKDRN